MGWNKFFLFLLLGTVNPYFLLAQSGLDSLWTASKSTLKDTNTVVACNTLANEIVGTEPQKAITLTKKALDISTQIKFNDGITWSYALMSEGFEYLGKIDSAASCLERARQYKVQFHDTQGVARMDMNLGNLYLNQGFFKPASEALFRALFVFDRLKDKSQLSKVYNNLGLLFRRSKNNKTALEYYEKSLALKRELNDKKGEAVTLGNMAMLLYYQKEYEASVKSALDGYKVCKEGNHMAYAAMCLSAAAQSLVKLGKTEHVDSYLTEVQDLITEYPDELDEAGYHLARADLFQAQNQYEEAIHSIQQAVAIYERREMLEPLQNCYSSLSRIYAENKQNVLAMEWLDKSVEIADTIYQRENMRQINEMNILYKTQSKERENENLRMENKLEQMRSESSKNQRNFLFLFLVVFLGLGVWITRLLLQKNKAYDQLEKNQLALQDAVEQKDTLLRELHHRVKNNLQVVTGLLDLQMARIKDEDVIKALNDGKNRIRSMALIHQKLYRTDDLKSVDMQEYFEKLLQEIMAGFAMPDKKISTFIDAGNIQLDIDIAIPLGLAVNELVTNSFKYAFQHQLEGKIEVKLYREESSYFLLVKDNGPGYEASEKVGKSTLGLRLVNMLTKQIRGKLEIHNFSGTEVQIQF